MHYNFKNFLLCFINLFCVLCEYTIDIKKNVKNDDFEVRKFNKCNRGDNYTRKPNNKISAYNSNKKTYQKEYKKKDNNFYVNSVQNLKRIGKMDAQVAKDFRKNYGDIKFPIKISLEYENDRVIFYNVYNADTISKKIYNVNLNNILKNPILNEINLFINGAKSSIEFKYLENNESNSQFNLGFASKSRLNEVIWYLHEDEFSIEFVYGKKEKLVSNFDKMKETKEIVCLDVDIIDEEKISDRSNKFNVFINMDINHENYEQIQLLPAINFKTNTYSSDDLDKIKTSNDNVDLTVRNINNNISLQKAIHEDDCSLKDKLKYANLPVKNLDADKKTQINDNSFIKKDVIQNVSLIESEAKNLISIDQEDSNICINNSVDIGITKNDSNNENLNLIDLEDNNMSINISDDETQSEYYHSAFNDTSLDSFGEINNSNLDLDSSESQENTITFNQNNQTEILSTKTYLTDPIQRINMHENKKQEKKINKHDILDINDSNLDISSINLTSNYENICYLKAFIYFFLNNKKVISFFEEENFKSNKIISCALKKLISKARNKKNKNIINIDKFTRDVLTHENFDEFSIGTQQCFKEFYDLFIDGLKIELNSIQKYIESDFLKMFIPITLNAIDKTINESFISEALIDLVKKEKNNIYENITDDVLILYLARDFSNYTEKSDDKKVIIPENNIIFNGKQYLLSSIVVYQNLHETKIGHYFTISVKNEILTCHDKKPKILSNLESLIDDENCYILFLQYTKVNDEN